MLDKTLHKVYNNYSEKYIKGGKKKMAKMFFEGTCEKLARDLAYQANWNGKEITRVYLQALTEANFHTMRKKVARLVNKELNCKLRLAG